MTDGMITRDTAQSYVTKLTFRAKEVNRDDTYAFRIKRLVVYGRVVDDPYALDLDRVDVGYVLAPRYEGEMQRDLVTAIEESCPIERMFSFMFDERHEGERWYDDLDPDVANTIKFHRDPWHMEKVRVRWPVIEVLAHLRMRSPFIRMHDIDTEADRIFAGKWMELDLIGDRILLDYSPWPRRPDWR